VSKNFIVRPADPADAEALVRLAEAVSSEAEAWLISADGEWRSVGDERRYLKAVRRYPHAAVYVAERGDGAIIGRLSLARDTHPASSHVADLGLMVAVDARRQGVAVTTGALFDGHTDTRNARVRCRPVALNRGSARRADGHQGGGRGWH